MREPTSDECSAGARVELGDGRMGTALWYPSMGGYVSHCVVLDGDGDESCVDLLVWHDGDFPFGDGESPRELHHCSPEDFERFGKALARILDSQGESG